MPMQVLDLLGAMAKGRLGRPPMNTGNPEVVQENQFRTALLNGFGQFFIVILVLAGYQVYVLLESFLRPLAWALLTGTILFPFKTAMAGWGKLWIKNLKETETPLAMGLLKTPFNLADVGLDYLGDIVVQIFRGHTSSILWTGILLAAAKFFQLILYLTRVDVIGLTYWMMGLSIGIAASDWVWSVLIAYGGALLFMWKPQHKHRIQSLAIPVHSAIAIHLVAKFGFIAFPVIIFAGAVLGIGFISELKTVVMKFKVEEKQDFIQSKIDEWGAFSILSPWNFPWWPGLVGTKTGIASGSLQSVNVEELPDSEEQLDKPNSDSPESDMVSEADRYLKSLLKLFVIVQLWQNAELLPLLVFPTVYSYLKEQIPRSNVYVMTVQGVQDVGAWLWKMVGDRKEALLPRSAVGLYKMALFGDRKILNILGSSMDEAASNFMIFLMFIVVMFSGVFVVYQVQQETAYIVRMSGEFMEMTITEHPEYLKWLPEGTQVQDRLQNSVDSLYVYGRQFVGDSIRKAVEGENSTSTDQITNEVLTMMDRIYYSLVSTSNNSTNQSALAASENTSHVLTELNESGALMEKASNMFSFSFLVDYGYAHFETVYSIFNSVIVIVKENGALIASMATSILSFVLTYFSQFLDFILNAVFFLAALSFLLSLSGERYYPLEKVSHLTTYFPEAGNVANVIEQAISGIFNASFKMATFYGVYTYTLLSIFGVYVKFIPSVVAGIFAVIPLFPPYIVCIPALLELLVIRQDFFLSTLLAIGSYIPSTFVDEVMYREVKTAHPYMFGLSVAGGLMTMGIEGVVVGPIVLCAFVIVVELSRMILKPSEEEHRASD